MSMMRGLQNNVIMTLIINNDNYECSRKTKVLLSVE